MRLGFAFLCEEVRLYDETSPAPAPLPPREERELGVTTAMQRKADAEAAAEAANAAAKEGRSINIRAGMIGYTEVVAKPRPLLSVMQLVLGPMTPRKRA